MSGDPVVVEGGRGKDSGSENAVFRAPGDDADQIVGSTSVGTDEGTARVAFAIAISMSIETKSKHACV